MMRRRLGLEHVGRTMVVVLRIAFASSLAAASAFVSWYGLDAWLGESALAQLVSLAAAFTAGTIVYLGAARALGLRELEALLLLRAQRSEGPDQR
jgi:hypothetical protein